MTAESHALGRLVAASRSGDRPRARDLDQGHNVYHRGYRFADTTHCQISNGMIRLTVGESGDVPTLHAEAWRGETTAGDVFDDVFDDTFGGSLSTPEWLDLGAIIIDSPSTATTLTAVRLIRISPFALTIRLVAPTMADAFVTLRRGERMVHIQHGSTRPPLVDIDRRVRLEPAPSGASAVQRVQEDFAAYQGFPRWIGAIDPATVNAGAFSLTAPSTISARFGVGAGTYGTADSPGASHAQLGNAARPRLAVT